MERLDTLVLRYKGLKMSENRTVTLSKHEVVLDIDTVDAIWEIAHGEDGWNRKFPDIETINVLNNYEKKKEQRVVAQRQNLDDLRRIRNDDKDYQKNLKFSLKVYGNMQSSLGFSAQDMLGERFAGDMGVGATARKP